MYRGVVVYQEPLQALQQPLVIKGIFLSFGQDDVVKTDVSVQVFLIVELFDNLREIEAWVKRYERNRR